jgi:signal transduction histidine kinase
LKIKDFIGFNNQQRTMIQIIDITGNILHDHQKKQNEMLSMINACVSHDLRNPLNSIRAMNIEKKYIYNIIDKMLENEDLTKDELIRSLKKSLLKLVENVTVQEYSCNLMNFTIQDLLDYAQIKANKFRKIISKINIVETV